MSDLGKEVVNGSAHSSPVLQNTCVWMDGLIKSVMQRGINFVFILFLFF